MAEETQNAQQTTHFDEETLMLYIDGELSPADAELLQMHLPVCSDCHQLWRELQDANLTFSQFHQTFNAHLPAPPRNWEGFESKIRATLAQPVVAPLPWWTGLASSLRQFFSGPLQPWTLSGATAAVAIAALLLHAPAKQRYSVNDVLSRSEHENAEQVAYASPVLYQKFRITDSAAPQRAVTVQMWSNHKLGRFREVVASNSPAPAAKKVPGIAAEGQQGQLAVDLHAVYDANHLPWNEPVSASAFRSWAQSAQQTQESMREDHLANGELVYQLTAQAATPATGTAIPFLRTMELLVRASDWHAVAQRLTMSSPAGEHTYEVAELEYRLIPLSQVPGSLFAAQDSALAAVSDAGAQMRPDEKPTQADLAVEVLERLDHADALVQDQVVVARADAGKLEIRGIVRNESRKAELLASLGPLASDPAVELDLLSAGSARSSASAASHPIQLQSVEVPVNQAGSLSEVRNYLNAHRHLAERDLDQATDRFVTEAIGHSTAAQLNAQALKNIIEIDPGREAGSVSPQTREKWRLLVQSHALASLHEVQLLEQQLAPVFSHAATSEVNLPAQVVMGEDLSAATKLLLSQTTESDRILWQAFSSNASTTDRNGLTDAKFWTMLKEECAVATKLGEKAHP